jgi:hypothetical protein
LAYRVDNGTQAAVLPTPAAAGTGGFFTEGSAAGGIPATIVDNDWLNMVQEEIAGVVLAASIALSKGTNTQLLTALKKLFQAAGSYVNMGGGIGQTNNQVDIGWSTTGLKATVDTTDLGLFAFRSYTDATFATLSYVQATYETAANAAATFATYPWVNTNFPTFGYVAANYAALTGANFTGSINVASGNNVSVYSGFLCASPYGAGVNPTANQQVGATLSSTGSVNCFSGSQAAGIFGIGGSVTAICQFIWGPNVVGQITTTTGFDAVYGSNSDYRIKSNVLPLADATSMLDALRPITYDVPNALLGGPSSSRHTGFIAHELQAIVPHVVHGEKDAVDEDGKMLLQSVDYGKLTPLVVAALQESNARIAALEAKIATLSK